MDETVHIESIDFWVEIVEMLQQNWALVESDGRGGARICFISDASGVFDEMTYPSLDDALKALYRNGFRHFNGEPDLQDFLRPPSPPYRRASHPNGPIYSSGRFWRS